MRYLWLEEMVKQSGHVIKEEAIVQLLFLLVNAQKEEQEEEGYDWVKWKETVLSDTALLHS